MKSVPRSSQHTVEFTASLPFSQHSLLIYNTLFQEEKQKAITKNQSSSLLHHEKESN